MYAFSIFPPVNISITPISKTNISCVRPLDPLLGLRPWTPLGDFRPQDTFPFALIHPPKVVEPLTPLYMFLFVTDI